VRGRGRDIIRGTKRYKYGKQVTKRKGEEERKR
jgi:hypothetical protein